MRYYSNSEEEKFFENKRFSDSNLPTYDDILFMLKDNKKIRNTKGKLELEKYLKIKDQIISDTLWNKIKNISYFDYSKDLPLKNLRKEVFLKNSRYLDLINSNLIYKFEDFKYNNDKTIKQALKNINIETYSSMYEYFAKGENIGTCGISSQLMGVMFENVKSCKGIIDSFKGTKNCDNGIHAWILADNKGKSYVVDTSLLLMIPEEYSKMLGYIPNKTYDIKDLINEENYVGDILYYHYNDAQKKDTKNKASYDKYYDYKEKMKNKTINNLKDGLLIEER